MKILIWTGKHGDTIVAAHEGGEEARAWLYLFKLIDEMGYYCDLDADEKDAHTKAKAGNAQAAHWLLSMRDRYEYEQVRVERIIVP
jgi:hypothetical protein